MANEAQRTDGAFTFGLGIIGATAGGERNGRASDQKKGEDARRTIFDFGHPRSVRVEHEISVSISVGIEKDAKTILDNQGCIFSAHLFDQQGASHA